MALIEGTAAAWPVAVFGSMVALTALAGCSQAVDLDSLSANRHQADASVETTPVDAAAIVDALLITDGLPGIDTAEPLDAGASDHAQGDAQDDPQADPDASSRPIGSGSSDGGPQEDGVVDAAADYPEDSAALPDATEAPDSDPDDGGNDLSPPASTDAATLDGPTPDATPMCTRRPSQYTTLYLASNTSTTTGCGYARGGLTGSIAAVDPTTFAGSGSCGACVRIETAAAVVVAQVVDLGPDATTHHSALAVNRAALNLLVPDGSTFVDQGVAWRFVPCPLPPSTGMTFQFQEGSNANYAALLIQKHRFRLANVEYRSNGRFRSLTRASYNYWVADAGMGGGPFTLRITDVDGHSVEQTGVPLKPGVVFQGQAQFPECAGD